MMECQGAWSAPGVSLLGSPRPCGNGAKFAARVLLGCRGVWAVPHSTQGVPAGWAEKIQAEGAPCTRTGAQTGRDGGEGAGLMRLTSGTWPETRPERGGFACWGHPCSPGT